jgi:hypothetical protein
MANSVKKVKSKPLPDVLPQGAGEVKTSISCIFKWFSSPISPTIKSEYILGLVTTLKLLVDDLIKIKKCDLACSNINMSSASQEDRKIFEKLVASKNSEEDKDIIMAMLEITALCGEDNPSISHIYQVISGLRFYNALVKRKINAESLFADETSQQKSKFKEISEDQKRLYKEKAKEMNIEKGLVIVPGEAAEKVTDKR